MDSLKLYLQDCYIDAPQHLWDSTGLAKIANHRMSSNALGLRSSLLHGDANILIAKWFIESIFDFESCKEKDPGYANVCDAVKKSLREIFPRHPADERNDYAQLLAKKIYAGIRSRLNNRRKANSLSFRQEIIDNIDSPPRCYLCGYKFDEDAVNCFLDIKQYNKPPLSFVDYLKPHGLSSRDFRLELDHVFPFSLGGGNDDNLKIACGWCNKHKSNKIVLYEANCSPKVFNHPQRGRTSCPQPLWVIRAISAKQKCEHIDGCKNRIENSQLTVTPLNPEGGMLPSNLKVICYEHDPIKDYRMVPATAFR
ncbi:hypothetical protein D0S45_17635 [Marinifilum sp. JC120]|nr:hypothetical protein D0S45_17635 [Marinifilum sp. JC120]